MTLRKLIEEALKQAMERPEILDHEVVREVGYYYVVVDGITEVMASPGGSKTVFEIPENGMKVPENGVCLIKFG